ncbi:hypothetical protein LINPERPRIM_LOCUS39334 [Linum perenne]
MKVESWIILGVHCYQLSQSL